VRIRDQFWLDLFERWKGNSKDPRAGKNSLRKMPGNLSGKIVLHRMYRCMNFFSPGKTVRPAPSADHSGVSPGTTQSGKQMIENKKRTREDPFP